MTAINLPPPEQLEKALRRAFDLGQTYWRQADSESYKQNKLADETLTKFWVLVGETVASLSAITADRQERAGAEGFVTWDLPKPELRIEDQLQPNGSPVCEDCDTVDHCMRCGCVPKVPLAASVQGTPAPAGWWTEELERIFNAAPGQRITDNMKRAAAIALHIARGERWDDTKQEWTAGVAPTQGGDDVEGRKP